MIESKGALFPSLFSWGAESSASFWDFVLVFLVEIIVHLE